MQFKRRKETCKTAIHRLCNTQGYKSLHALCSNIKRNTTFVCCVTQPPIHAIIDCLYVTTSVFQGKATLYVLDTGFYLTDCFEITFVQQIKFISYKEKTYEGSNKWSIANTIKTYTVIYPYFIYRIH